MRFLTSDIERAGRDAGPHHVWWRPRVSRGARHVHFYESTLVLLKTVYYRQGKVSVDAKEKPFLEDFAKLFPAIL